MDFSRSQDLFQEAKKLIPGGVNSPVRAFGSVRGEPIFFTKGQGAYLTDVDGNRYIDYVNSWGPLILGYSHPRIVEALREEVSRGTTFGAPCEWEIKLARAVVDMVPSVEVVRMVNSGTEATMSAIRLARAYTRRDKIIKFSGCYHGHGDSFLIQAGSGATTLGIPSSPGVPEAVAAQTLSAPFNNLAAVEKLFKEEGENIGAIILEPFAANMGLIPPEKGFLEGLRDLADEYEALLIFDEVMTGFRVAPGGAQEITGITPDLTTMGKVIGGGLPVGAYGGKEEIMRWVAPDGPVYQAGTLSGNPLAMRAGWETLQILGEGDFFENLEKKSEALARGIKENIEKLGVPLSLVRQGSMGSLFFSETPPINYDEARQGDTEKYADYFQAMLEEGIYLAPSAFEVYFVSSALGDEEIEKTLQAQYRALEKVFSTK